MTNKLVNYFNKSSRGLIEPQDKIYILPKNDQIGRGVNMGGISTISPVQNSINRLESLVKKRNKKHSYKVKAKKNNVKRNKMKSTKRARVKINNKQVKTKKAKSKKITRKRKY